MFTEVRWLSRGKYLERFFEVRKEVVEFIELEFKDFELLDEIKSQALAFLTDLTTHLNFLNISLQGKNKSVFDLVDLIKGFLKKIDIFIYDLKMDEIFHFPCLKTILNNDYNILNFDFFKYLSQLDDLKKLCKKV